MDRTLLCKGGQRRAEKSLPVIAVGDPGPAGRSLQDAVHVPGTGRTVPQDAVHVPGTGRMVPQDVVPALQENGLRGRADGGVGRRGWDTRRESHGNVCATIREIESGWDFAVSLGELRQGSVTT